MGHLPQKSTSDEGRFTGVLSESKVDLNPHQVEAAIFAFKSPLSKGAILADEVGLGKPLKQVSYCQNYGQNIKDTY